jgi:hypothetical protein
MLIGTTKAANLLDLCCQRVRQLLKAGRILGARKIGRFWQIPLYNGMPKVIPGKRGPKSTCRKRMQEADTRIHINRKKFDENRAKEKQDPIIAVHKGSRPPVYYDEVEITGACRMIYRPDKPLSCGAVLWIEVDPGVEIKPLRFVKV